MIRSVGRPRNKQIDEQILSATARILAEKGYAGLKMDTVATVAKVSKHTLYLRYKSPAQLTVALLHQLASSTIKLADTGSLEKDLTQLLKDIRQLFLETPFGIVIPALIGASTGNPKMVKRARLYLEERRALMEPLVTRAIERGELPKSVRPREFIETCLAPIYYRYLISGDPINDKFIASTVKRALSVS